MPRERPAPRWVPPTRPATATALENLARIGLIAYGVVHLLVAWLALQLAWFGGGGESADQSGAMSTVAESPVGKPLLWVIAVGLIALAAWQAAEVLRWRSGWSASGKTRTKALRKSGNALVKAAIYIALAVLAIRFATGSGQSSSQSQQETTAGVLGWPGGQFIVGAAGLILIGSGVWHVRKGLTKTLPEADRHLRGVAEGAPPGHPARAGRLPRQGGRPRAGRRPARLRRDHLRPVEGPGPGRRAAHRAGAAVRPDPAHPGGPRASPPSARSSSCGPATRSAPDVRDPARCWTGRTASSPAPARSPTTRS